MPASLVSGNTGALLGNTIIVNGLSLSLLVHKEPLQPPVLSLESRQIPYKKG